MSFRIPALTALSLAVLAAPLSAAVDDAPAKPAEEKKICHSEATTGTLMRRKVCHTAAEWEAIRKANQGNLDEMMNRTQVAPGTRG